MPVFKYRRIEDMPEPWMIGDDRKIGARLRTVLNWATLPGPIGFPRGVHKYRTIEEMQADRERWEDERIARIRAERLQK
ncbi:MAG TPA: hypothetical protein VFN10_23695 [Thermoanaerobaculia bacterium]|nr:hypothetical protein [Thermoanaerobaculia bacterium]